ncbi:MAG: hypothetical protein NTW04_02975 [Elusimicrobia bacterium]|nr:hypothetical protein [Elusimicrobiota bacterium]
MSENLAPQKKTFKQWLIENKWNFLFLAVSAVFFVAVNYLNIMKITRFLEPKAPKAKHVMAQSVVAPIPHAKQVKIDETVTSFKLTLSGTPKFERDMTRALTLLAGKAEGAFKVIEKNIYAIKQAPTASFVLDGDIPTAYLPEKTSKDSDAWIASLAAREAFHAYVYYKRQKKALAAKRPPKLGAETEQEDDWYSPNVSADITPEEEKIAADDFQADILRRLTANQDIPRIKTLSAP